jgi:NSS family neurotransmitter:Na+ symporter
MIGIILIGGVTKGIDKANKIFIPTLFFIILGMMTYTMTLDGAGTGLKTMFSFHGNNLLSPGI